MAAINSGDKNRAPFAGEQGNVSAWDGYYKMPAAGTIGDTIDLFEVPAGAKISEIAEVHSAHGGTAAMVIGWKYKDGSAGGSASALKASASTVAAGNSVVALSPLALFGASAGVVDKPIIVYVTNSGSAIPLNGEVYVKATGEYYGLK
jgi:hypothetical protein